MTPEQIGEKLQAYRKAQGHSIARACRICEVGERIWRRWEKGQVALPLPVIKCYMLETNGTFRREEWE